MDGSWNIRCNCPPFSAGNSWIHIDLITKVNESWSRLRSFVCRNVSPTVHLKETKGRSALKLPRLRGDNVDIWHIFIREELMLQRARVSTSVFVDRRASRVLKRPLTARVRCSECKGAPGNRWRCIHERSCYSKIAKENGDTTDQEEEVVSYDDENAPESYISPYCSRLPRRFFPCSWELNVTKDVGVDVIAWTSALNKNEENKYALTVTDSVSWCGKCYLEFRGGDYISAVHPVNLTTATFGTATIGVHDKYCPKCHSISPYDGRGDGIFCISKTNAVTRELLELWMYSVCGMGNTFRDAFSTCKSMATSVSGRILCPSHLPTLKRRQGSKAFSCFLSL